MITALPLCLRAAVLDVLARRLTAAPSLAALLEPETSYRPSLCPPPFAGPADVAAYLALADGYDRLEAGAGRRNKKAERQLQQLTLTLQAQAAQPARRPDAMAAAKAYLLAALQAGPVRAGAKAVGVSGMTLKRARDKMQIKSFRCGGIGAGGHWWWSLPPVGGAS